MHEYHLAKSILNSVLERVKSFAGVKSIVSIRLKIGILKMVTAETLGGAFHQIAKGSICENTVLDIEEVEGDVLEVERVEAEFENNS
jgi:Zn finger protein HypA/HybF involved in hydrogenase expression